MFPRLPPLGLIIIIITTIIVTAACGGEDGTGPAVIVTVDVSPDTATVQAGATLQFTATARDRAGDPISGVTFTWSSSRTSVATVDVDGLATGVVAGTANISATASGVTGSGFLTVIPNASPDPPDNNFLDTNGDGIDGDIARAIFVASWGLEANPGTPEAPKNTIASAIAAVQADPNKSEIYVSSGTYAETVVLVDGISIYGGYDGTANWSRSFGNTATIDGDTIAVIGQSITQITVLDLLTILSADNTSQGGNSVGVYLAGSEQVRLRNLTIVAGAGGAGIAGIVGAQGLAGLDGQAGAITAGGAGGDTVSGVQPSGKGGDGGNGAAAVAAAGGNGQDGLAQPGGGIGGLGGPPAGATPDDCNLNGLLGNAGGLGSNGVNGGPGLGGDGQGSVLGGYWLGSRGNDGGLGTPGFGGGGGGGGSAARVQTAICQAFPGGGGGGGGSGGQAGDPGGGGGGGGGSFGVFAYNSVVILEQSDITAGDGGIGGSGGDGGPGGSGGAGGLGSNGDASQGVFTGGRGGDGGPGGAGGEGGPGGGGGGGVSYAVYATGTSSVQIDAGTTLTAGNGGAGGTAPTGGNAGQQGASGEKNF